MLKEYSNLISWLLLDMKFRFTSQHLFLLQLQLYSLLFQSKLTYMISSNYHLQKSMVETTFLVSPFWIWLVDASCFCDHILMRVLQTLCWWLLVKCHTKLDCCWCYVYCWLWSYSYSAIMMTLAMYMKWMWFLISLWPIGIGHHRI